MKPDLRLGQEVFFEYAQDIGEGIIVATPRNSPHYSHHYLVKVTKQANNVHKVGEITARRPDNLWVKGELLQPEPQPPSVQPSNNSRGWRNLWGLLE